MRAGFVQSKAAYQYWCRSTGRVTVGTQALGSQAASRGGERFCVCERWFRMSISTEHGHTVEIVPCAGATPSYRWIIRRSDGSALRRSPYAFSTEKGALISAECWSRELTEAGIR
ncbi:hypothetical protein KHHGKMAE_2767 [Methylobacterium persicinum]|jgi:hypothetical protein|nr:hypothetical protein KHHGKMAE_2767 [Methylobacterium persicinum]